MRVLGSPGPDTWTEYGLLHDCDNHDCDPRHEDAPIVVGVSRTKPTVAGFNQVSAVIVERTVTYGDWRRSE